MTKFLSFSLAFLLWACASGDSGSSPTEEPDQTITPLAVDDQVVTMVNYTRAFTNLTINDKYTSQASIKLTASSQSGGQLDLISGVVHYTPPTDFVGMDTFSYQLCTDSDFCSTAQVEVEVLPSISLNVPEELKGYYSGLQLCANSGVNEEILSALTQSQHTTILSYGQRHNYLYNADADLNEPTKVVLMYSGELRYWEEYTSGNNPYTPQTFNTEHVYPKSKLNSDDAITDLHHLRACDAEVNSNKSNYAFTDGSGNYGVKGGKWYPGDDWRGDVARMMFYLHIRYNENLTTMGGINLFLKWHVEDPVSELERQRNEVIVSAQGNRNPFIDNPYLATLIWGGEAAENLWE